MINDEVESANIIWLKGLNVSDASLFISSHHKPDPLMLRLQELINNIP